MEGNAIPALAPRGEATITFAGQPLKIRFSLAVLHEYTTKTGRPLTALAHHFGLDTLGTVGGLLAAAVRRASGKPFDLDDAFELLENMQQEEADALAEAIWAAIRVDETPLIAALGNKAPKPAPRAEETADTTSGGATSTSPSVS